ncbi:MULTISPECIES: hypothetical protein [Pontibacillus]|uniref:Uncharacterized protein n=1 Tax=Pontibacillus chungwhensis TaxID=265426 RepID=A0ABY8V3P5_9BACI|nr:MULTISPECIES: hypothetical protein [Pontibacillus]MCD5324472.1 hypothetical protein [Pontibacillus sp. HN14]WIF99235.1 hypothetical protein QNI29_06125 [Pontibacillus chungwhensis]
MSYTPTRFDAMYEEFVADLHKIFLTYQQNVRVTFHDQTEVCVGQFALQKTEA